MEACASPARARHNNLSSSASARRHAFSCRLRANQWTADNAQANVYFCGRADGTARRKSQKLSNCSLRFRSSKSSSSLLIERISNRVGGWSSSGRLEASADTRQQEHLSLMNECNLKAVALKALEGRNPLREKDSQRAAAGRFGEEYASPSSGAWSEPRSVGP